MVDLVRLESSFLSRYGKKPRVFSAPGRVNLIGEHTDYNDGFVLPMAIDRRTYVAAAARDDGKLRAASLTIAGEFEAHLERPSAPRRGVWADYIEGVAQALLRRGFPVRGADLLIDSEVPAGAGLSASAALELAVGYALAVLGGTEQPDRVRLALAGQEAEHVQVGTLCGIMDQYISALGQEGRALLIDCRSLDTTSVALNLGSAELVVCDTRVRHELSSSEYNVRRAECQSVVAHIAAQQPAVKALRDVSLAELESRRSELEETLFRRARHVITENERTLLAAEALERGEVERMGQLMSASHQSLRDDYEVSCRELDLAVEVALATPGVFGSRMTGGGFGGCTVTLVEKEVADHLAGRLVTELTAAFGSQPQVVVFRACAGVREEPTLGTAGGHNHG